MTPIIDQKQIHKIEYARPPTDAQWGDLKKRVGKGEAFAVNLFASYLLDKDASIRDRAIGILKEINKGDLNTEIVKNLTLMANIQEVLEEQNLEVLPTLFQKLLSMIKNLIHYLIGNKISYEVKNIIETVIAISVGPKNYNPKKVNISLDYVKISDIKQKVGTNFCHVLGPILALIHNGKFDLLKDRISITDTTFSVRFEEKTIIIDKNIYLDSGEKQLYSESAEWVELLLMAYHKYIGDAMLNLEHADRFYNAIGIQTESSSDRFDLLSPEEMITYLGEQLQEKNPMMLINRKTTHIYAIKAMNMDRTLRLIDPFDVKKNVSYNLEDPNGQYEIIFSKL